MTPTELKILLIEDDAADVRLIEVALEEADFSLVALTKSGCFEQALEQLASGTFDVILLDLGLPDCGGLDALVRIRDEFSETPVVVLTGNTDDEIGFDAIAAGAQEYLRKGELTPCVLHRVLRYAVKRQQLVVQLQEANQLLSQKNQRLAQLYETAHQFVDHVSHEFRTPLTVIKEYVTLIHDGLTGQVSEQQRAFLEIVNDRADDLAIIVDDMLDVSKLEAGLLNVWRRKTQLADVFDHVRSTLGRKATIKNVDLEFSLPSSLPDLFCDPDKIGRVIVNLVVNAIKFCDENGAVRLWALPPEEGASEITVGISDNGPGIASENLRLIFNRFQQLEPAAHSSTKGFGLGLSIAKELVTLNLGNIDVQSEAETGSTFTFTIPTWEPTELVHRLLQRLSRRKPQASHVAVVTATIASDVAPSVSNVVDEFLQHALCSHDLVLPTAPHRWAFLMPVGENEVDMRIQRIEMSWAELNRSRPSGMLPTIEFRVAAAHPLTENTQEIVESFLVELPPCEHNDQRRRILLVDDDQQMLRGLEIRLQAAGFETITATDGRAALVAAEEHLPDAILMDNYMPQMSGLDALVHLAATPGTKEIPVIMISASLRDRQAALNHGARYFLQKPCDMTTINAALRDVLPSRMPAGAM